MKKMMKYGPLPFFDAIGIVQKDVVCIVGAGGKTSLMFHLAKEAIKRNYKILVTTSTKILVPDPIDYDAIDLSGKLFTESTITTPGIYVGGQIDLASGKMTGVDVKYLLSQKNHFDLILIEGDGAAKKPLKGWNSTEPVVPGFTTKTVGVIDIQTIGAAITSALVHRLEIFLGITGAKAKEMISIQHILRIITHENGLFQYSQGEKIVYFNKVESKRDRSNVNKLQHQLSGQKVIAGSVRKGVIYQ